MADPVRTFAPGTHLDDFEIVREVGRGASGVVYLARQLSLDRHVALKVSAILGDEARTMAQLEHPHIVQVYSETLDPAQDLRLLCMQYVEGITLESVISRMSERDSQPITGRTMLEAVHDAVGQNTEAPVKSQRGSELATASTREEVTCLIGAQLADALAYAHDRDVLHRDIKPANILIDTRGRPYLADFNLSSQSAADPSEDRSTLFGGTLPYMAPEHLDAFNPGNPTTPAAVDKRSDVYSLGVVIHQLYTRRLPFPVPSTPSLNEEVLQQLAKQRREAVVTLRETNPDVPVAIEHAIQQCLKGERDDRYQHADDVRAALDGCRELVSIQQQIQPRDSMTSFFARRPVVWALLATFIPQLLAVGLFFAFGMLRLFPQLDSIQQSQFDLLGPALGVPLFLGTLPFLFVSLSPIYWVWVALQTGHAIDPEQVLQARQNAARFPRLVLWVDLVTWGFALVATATWCHYTQGDQFLVWDFWASGLLSATLGSTCNVFAVQYIMTCLVYPYVWADASNIHRVATRELNGTDTRTRLLQALAGTVPLAAVVLVLSVGQAEFDESGVRVFQFLSITLVILGMGLFQLSNLLARRVLDTVKLMTTIPSGD